MSLETHDRGLKFLLAQDPLGFLRFGLGTDDLQVLCPVESDLPARDRLIDGVYLIERQGVRQLAHLEFFRMHQGLIELGLDIGEAQVRLRRKEGVPVYSLLWDLYGSRQAKVLQRRVLFLGAKGDPASTRVCYQRVNLRGMGAAELLARAPRSLYALVPLTRDGGDIEQVRQAKAAIEAR